MPTWQRSKLVANCGISEGLRGERPDTTKVEAPRLLPREARTAHARSGGFTEQGLC